MVRKIEFETEIPERGEVYKYSLGKKEFPYVVLDTYCGLCAWNLPTHANVVRLKHNDDETIISGLKESLSIESIMKGKYLGKIHITDKEIGIGTDDHKQLNNIANRIHELIKSS